MSQTVNYFVDIKMSLFLVIIGLMTSSYQTDAQAVLMGTPIVKYGIEKLHLNCAFQKTQLLDFNVKQMTINKDHEPMITLSGNDQVKIFQKNLSIQAVGVIGDVTGRSYLTITVDNPSKSLASEYICSVSAVGQEKKTIIFTSLPFKVKIVQPKYAELVKFYTSQVSDLENSLVKMMGLIQTMNQSQVKMIEELNEIKNNEQKTQQSLNNLAQNGTNTKLEIENQRKQLSDLVEDLNKIKNTEQKTQQSLNILALNGTNTNLEIEKQRKKFSDLEQKTQQNFIALNLNVTNMKLDMENQKSLLSASTIYIREIQTKITPHLEQGQVEFGNDVGGFPKTKDRVGYYSVHKPVVFKKPFDSTPIVVYSVRHIDVGSREFVRYMFFIENVRTTGFTMVCGTFAHGVVDKIAIQWTAFNNN